VRPPRLYLNHLPDLDWLIALEFGRVDNGQSAEDWSEVGDDFAYLHDGPGGSVLGFKVLDFSEFDPHAPEVEPIWWNPRFDAPAVGLSDATAGEIVVATRALHGDGPSINRVFFNLGTRSSGTEALGHWLACLQSGDSMAHFALGYTLYELGRFHEAYRHLRHYTEIAPHGSWNWCWFGKAAEAINELEEAHAAYERALDLEEESGEPTDAGDLLERLERRGA
jgi:tetratricopeptide (TPR) repeat protein